MFYDQRTTEDWPKELQSCEDLTCGGQDEEDMKIIVTDESHDRDVQTGRGIKLYCCHPLISMNIHLEIFEVHMDIRYTALRKCCHFLLVSLTSRYNV